MADYLVIRLGADSGNMANWIAADSNGTRRSPPVAGPLAAAAKDVGDRTVIVLVPAAAVITTTADIPVRGGARLLAALPYALEENFAEDVDKLHFAAGTRYDSGLLRTCVVSHAQMGEWLAQLDEAGIQPAQIIPENHGLARIPGTLSLLVAEGQVMFNDGAENEFVMQGIKPSDVLAVAGALQEPGLAEDSEDDSEQPAGHLLVYCEPVDEERYVHDWNALRHELASVDLNLLPDGVLPRLAVTVAAGRGINLLQGRYGAKTDFGSLFQPWRFAAMLLLTLALVGVMGKGVDYYRLTREAAALKEQFTQEHLHFRPDFSGEIVDPVGVVNSIRKELGAPETAQVFLPSLQRLSQAMQQNSAANIEGISYRAGVIDVRLTAPDVSTLDSIQKLVGDSGQFSASIQSTDQIGDKVSSRIQIREAGV